MKRLMDMVPTRRDVLKFGGMALAGTWLDQVVGPLSLRAYGKANPRGTARNVIFIEMGGAISPWDTWDYKEQTDRKQPKDLNVQKTSTGVFLSKTLFPQMFDQWSQVSLVRSMRANELVHFNGQYHTQTGRTLAPPLAREVPAWGSLAAFELDAQRRETDTFPAYVSTTLASGFAGTVSAGFLHPRFATLDLTATTVFDTFGGDNSSMNRLLEERWNQLSLFSEVSGEGRRTFGNREGDYQAYYQDAYRILTDSRWPAVFKASQDDKQRYGDDEYGLGLILARNLLAANAGTRIVYVYDGSRWDQHTQIFDRNARLNHYVNCVRWDKGFASLLKDLASMPGQTPGKTLLDETLIVAASEFSRTPAINPTMGRHHYRYAYTTLFAGGGIKPGRVLGATADKDGTDQVTDTGWKHKEQPRMDNVLATIYSALGIDWLKEVENTPSGRGYKYIEKAPLAASEFQSDDSIDELFA